MKFLHNMHFFCIAVIIEMVAELLTDSVEAYILLAVIMALMSIIWFKQHFPHFPWRNPWDDDDWL